MKSLRSAGFFFFQKDILKLVSTGKRYDVGDDEEDAEDEKGLEIERVVAKLVRA